MGETVGEGSDGHLTQPSKDQCRTALLYPATQEYINTHTHEYTGTYRHATKSNPSNNFPKETTHTFRRRNKPSTLHNIRQSTATCTQSLTCTGRVRSSDSKE